MRCDLCGEIAEEKHRMIIDVEEGEDGLQSVWGDVPICEECWAEISEA